MVEPDNLVLELLRAIRADISKMFDEMEKIHNEIRPINQILADSLKKRMKTTN